MNNILRVGREQRNKSQLIWIEMASVSLMYAAWQFSAAYPPKCKMSPVVWKIIKMMGHFYILMFLSVGRLSGRSVQWLYANNDVKTGRILLRWSRHQYSIVQYSNGMQISKSLRRKLTSCRRYPQQLWCLKHYSFLGTIRTCRKLCIHLWNSAVFFKHVH